MRKKIYLLICTVVILSACTKQDEYKKYVNGEERIYRAKPAHLKISPGYLKAGIKFKLYNPIHVEKYEIYADNIKIGEGKVEYADSLEISTVITGLEEKTYQIDVVTVDNMNLSSVKTSGFLNVYGPRYQSSLNQRIPSKIISSEPGEIEMYFSEAESDVVESKIAYLNSNGQEVVEYLDREQSELKLTDVDPTGYLKYSTSILPSEISLDALLTTEEQVQLEDVERKWFSSEEQNGEGPNNGRVEHMFDQEINTFWHSQYQGASFSYPHWFIMDLGSTTQVNSFTITRRQGSNTGPSEVKLEGKNIGGEWVDLGAFNINNQVDDPQLVIVGSTLNNRYLRVTALKGPTAHICIAEFTIN